MAVEMSGETNYHTSAKVEEVVVVDGGAGESQEGSC